jgi:hypothetical protein
MIGNLRIPKMSDAVKYREPTAHAENMNRY